MPDEPTRASDELELARQAAHHLRAQLNLIVRGRASALEEVERLRVRGQRAGAATPALARVAERYARHAETLQAEIVALTALLAEQEVRVEELRADEAGA